MKGKKKISAVFATLMLIIGVFIVIPFPVHAQGAATLILPSKSWYVPIYDINTTALVPIKINTTNLVHSWEVSFTYDVAILQYLGATEADFLSKNGSTTFTPTGGAGQVDLNCTHNGATNNTQGLGVLETIATVMFNITDYGKSALTFGSCNVVDCDEVPFSLTKVDGYWETRAKVTIGLPSKSWFPPAYDIGSYFTMSLTIETVEKVSYWSTGIRFDNDTIAFISVTEGPFLSQAGGTTFSSGTNHNNGTVSGISCDHNGVGNYTQGQGYAETLATFTFLIKDYGKTEIDLTDLPGDLCETVVQDQNGDDCSLLELDDGSWELRAKVTVALEDVYLTPATHTLGDTFTVDLTINTSDTVSSWQGGVSWDNAILNCTGVTYGTYITGTPYVTYLELLPVIDNANGRLSGMGQSFLGGLSTTGAGILATIEFKILDYGKTTLELTDLDLDPTEFIATDKKGDELTVLALVDGSVEIRGGVAIALPYIPTWPSIGSTLTVELRIMSPEKVTSWQGGISFDNTVLNCTGVSYGTYITGTPYVNYFEFPYVINNTLGKVFGMGQSFLGGLYAPPTPVPGYGILATITFNVTGAYADWALITITDVDLAPTEIIVTDQNGADCSSLQLVQGLKVFGDVNANGKVDATDVFSHVALAYGTQRGDSQYRANCDFDRNGKVDPTDVFSYVALYYDPVTQYPYYP